MEKKKNVSMAVIKRMPKYYRYLGELVKMMLIEYLPKN